MGDVWVPPLAYNMYIAYFILHKNKLLFGAYNMCIAYFIVLNNKLLFGGKIAVRNFFTHGGGGIFIRPYPPYEKTVIRRIFIPPPSPWLG